jgi:hypothetical protein
MFAQLQSPVKPPDAYYRPPPAHIGTAISGASWTMSLEKTKMNPIRKYATTMFVIGTKYITINAPFAAILKTIASSGDIIKTPTVESELVEGCAKMRGKIVSHAKKVSNRNHVVVSHSTIRPGGEVPNEPGLRWGGR